LITKSLGIKSSRELPYWITVEVLPIILEEFGALLFLFEKTQSP
jgi:hypothetical protein